MTAYQLLAQGPHRFKQGQAYSDRQGRRCGPRQAVAFDALGAIWMAYRDLEPNTRRVISERAFDYCKAWHDHKRLGRLDYEQTLALFKAAGV